MMNRRPRPRRTSGQPPRDPIPGSGRYNLVALIAMGVGIYLLTLWFGVTVVGDTAGRSAIMALVILGIAATGYYVNGRKRPPRQPSP